MAVFSGGRARSGLSAHCTRGRSSEARGKNPFNTFIPYLSVHPFLRLMRPWQWYKNVVVFLALFFSGNLFDPSLFAKALLAFVAFCLISSGTYVFNDILDLEEDRKHPEKKNRPLPSGQVSVRSACALSLVLILAGLLALVPLSLKVLLAGIALVLNTLLYSLLFKRVAGADIAVVPLNFLFRTLAGVYAISVPLSPWIVVLPYFLAVYLVLLKRHGELRRAKVRRVLDFYTPQTLETLSASTIALLLALYTLYVFSKGYSTLAAMTIPVASFVLFRWHAVAMRDPALAENAHRVLGDRWFLAGTLLWALLLLWVIYA